MDVIPRKYRNPTLREIPLEEYDTRSRRPYRAISRYIARTECARPISPFRAVCYRRPSSKLEVLDWGGVERPLIFLTGPILAIVVCPRNFDRANAVAASKAAMTTDDRVRCTARADVFEAGVSPAQVVRLPNADRYVFNSNEADVIREINDFLGKLPSFQIVETRKNINGT